MSYYLSEEIFSGPLLAGSWRGRLDDSVGVPTGGEGSSNVVNKYAFQLYILHFLRFYGYKKRKIKMIKVMNVSLKLHLNS